MAAPCPAEVWRAWGSGRSDGLQAGSCEAREAAPVRPPLPPPAHTRPANTCPRLSLSPRRLQVTWHDALLLTLLSSHNYPDSLPCHSLLTYLDTKGFYLFFFYYYYSPCLSCTAVRDESVPFFYDHLCTLMCNVYFNYRNFPLLSKYWPFFEVRVMVMSLDEVSLPFFIYMLAILKLVSYGPLTSCRGLEGLTAFVNRAKLIQPCLEGRNITYTLAFGRVKTQPE